MEKRILVINGHPDPRPERFCAALCEAYERGADAGGWQTRRLEVGSLPLSGIASPGGDSVEDVSRSIQWASRLAIIYPLWFDEPPELLRLLFARLAQDTDAAQSDRAAHVIVTMDMPAFAFRTTLRPDDPAKERAARALSLRGIRPIEPVIIGCAASLSQEQRVRWLEDVRLFGERGDYGVDAPPPWFAMDNPVTRWLSGH